MDTVDRGRRSSVGVGLAVERAPAQPRAAERAKSPAASAPASPVGTSARHTWTSALIVSFLAPLLVAALVVAMMVAVLRQADSIDRADRALAALQRTQALLLDADRAVRGFLVAGKDEVLEPYRRALPALEAQVPALTALLAGQPEQLARVDALRQRIAEWQRTIDRQIAERRSAAALPRDVTAGPGPPPLEAMHADLDAMSIASEADRREREAWTDGATLVAIGVAIVSAVLVGLALAYAVRRRFAALAERDAQARTAPHAGDADLRLAFELGAAATAHIDPITHRFLRVSPAFVALTGYADAELAAMRLLDMTHPDDRESDLARFQSLRPGELAQYEKRAVRKDGSVRWVRVAASLVPAADGHAARIVASLSDVTDHQRAAEALRESAARGRRLLDHLPQLVWTARPSGECDHLGVQWLAYTGRPESEQLGDGWLDSVHPLDRERVAARWREAVRGGAGMTIEYRLRRHDGAYRWFELRAAPVADGAAGPRTWLASSHDIEPYKQVEDEARDRAGALERRIEERTAQSEDASRELEAFTYSVSHDLRSPLRRIDGFAELLGKALADGGSDKVPHYLGRIGAEAQRAGRLIDDLLELSRAGRAALRLQPVDAARLIADLRTELDEGNGRTLIWDVEPLPVVSADPAMLRVVFANLLSNAVKFTAPRAEAHIRVGSRRGDGETAFFIADDGVGFDMRHAGQLFGVFQRLHLAEEFEGSGIGLAIVHRIVSRHGGRVWVEAAEGEGATFWISLPDRPETARHA